jgi:hypothetical protein
MPDLTIELIAPVPAMIRMHEVHGNVILKRLAIVARHPDGIVGSQTNFVPVGIA